MTDKKIILFDLGGVLIHLNYQLTIDAFKSLGISNFQEIYTQAEQSQLFDDFETGKISAFHFINRLLDLLPKGCNPNQVVHAWNAMILDFPEKNVQLLEKLAHHKDLYLLSNTNDLHVEKVRQELKKVSSKPLESYFSKVYFSQEIGDRKPNPSVFQKVLADMGAAPEDVLFVDDSLQHIKSANELGIETIHLTQSLTSHPAFS